MNDESRWLLFVFCMVVVAFVSLTLGSEGYLPTLLANGIAYVAFGLVLLPTIIAALVGSALLSKWALRRVMQRA